MQRFACPVADLSRLAKVLSELERWAVPTKKTARIERGLVLERPGGPRR